MKIKGQKISSDKHSDLIIPRDTGDIHLVFDSVRDTEEFDKQFPAPTPPMRLMRGDKEMSGDYDDKGYQDRTALHNQARGAWIYLMTLRNTEDLEWETVDMKNFSTFPGVIQELNETFGSSEVSMIIDKIQDVNCLTNEKITQATNNFLNGQRAQQDKD